MKTEKNVQSRAEQTSQSGKKPTAGSVGSRQIKDAPLGILTKEERDCIYVDALTPATAIDLTERAVLEKVEKALDETEMGITDEKYLAGIKFALDVVRVKLKLRGGAR